MLKIGDFSKLSRVSVRMLRHYDALGLLHPARVDPQNGYRFYSADQLARLNRILALQDLGLSLAQVGALLREDLPVAQLRGMLRLKQAELEQQLQVEQERLARVAARLRQLEQEDTMANYEVALKEVPAQLAASLRGVVPNYQEVGALFGELYGYLESQGTGGLPVARWHDEGYKEQDVDAEALVYLERPVPATERVQVVELEAATMASVVHHGAYNRLHEAYAVLMGWVEANGYRIVGPNRELYLHCPEPMRQDDESYVTEIQFPVACG